MIITIVSFFKKKIIQLAIYFFFTVTGQEVTGSHSIPATCFTSQTNIPTGSFSNEFQNEADLHSIAAIGANSQTNNLSTASSSYSDELKKEKADGLILPTPNITSSDCTQFHEYCQKNGITPNISIIEFIQEPMQRIYKCVISIKEKNLNFETDSQQFFSRQNEAEEQACSNMLKILTILQEQVNTCSEISCRVQDEQINWKSKLKEYYDEKGEPNKEIVYYSAAVEGSEPPQFLSSVYIQELQRNVTGAAMTKKEAEQSAAQKAVLELKQ